MKNVMRSLGVALGVAIACGGGSDGLPDISAVTQAYCERELSCESDAWVDEEGCEQVATSIVAGFMNGLSDLLIESTKQASTAKIGSHRPPDGLRGRQ